MSRKKLDEQANDYMAGEIVKTIAKVDQVIIGAGLSRSDKALLHMIELAATAKEMGKSFQETQRMLRKVWDNLTHTGE
jgi:hypothetical protein